MAREHRQCLLCGQIKLINGRGMCSTCYSREYDAGNIEKYPRQNAGHTKRYDTCVDCDEYKHIFGRDRCRQCHQKWYLSMHPEVREKNAQRERDRRKTMGEAYRQKDRERNKKRKEQMSASNRAYYRQNADALKQYQKDYRVRERAKTQHMWRVTKQRRRKIKVDLTLEQWERIVAFYCPKGLCLSCGRAFDEKSTGRRMTMDHIVPVNAGGATCPDNIQPLCASCNSSKSDHRVVDYRPDRGEFARSLHESVDGS